MLHLATNGTRTKVNVLKKVKVDGQWKLCPVIAEAGGKLKDRVQVGHQDGHHAAKLLRRKEMVPKKGLDPQSFGNSFNLN